MSHTRTHTHTQLTTHTHTHTEREREREMCTEIWNITVLELGRKTHRWVYGTWAHAHSDPSPLTMTNVGRNADEVAVWPIAGSPMLIFTTSSHTVEVVAHVHVLHSSLAIARLRLHGISCPEMQLPLHCNPKNCGAGVDRRCEFFWHCPVPRTPTLLQWRSVALAVIVGYKCH